MTPHAIAILDDRSLRWQPTAPLPLPAGHVRLHSRATAVNRADLLQRMGRYPVPDGASEILGLEVAGVVTEVAADVTGISIGDAACALLEGGGYASEVVVDARMLLPVPAGFSFAEAAALPEVFYTAWLNLWREAELADGETVLIHAAASGVGTAALQLCRAFGHRTIATASGPKREQVEQWGADVFVDRTSTSFLDVVREQTHRGVDVILDPVGASYLGDNVRALAPRGRLVVIGLMGGARAELDMARLLMRRLRVVGSVLRSRGRAEKVEITEQIRQSVWPRFDDGSLRPVLHATLPIRDADAAHELLRENRTVGKVVLDIDRASSRP